MCDVARQHVVGEILARKSTKTYIKMSLKIVNKKHNEISHASLPITAINLIGRTAF